MRKLTTLDLALSLFSVVVAEESNVAEQLDLTKEFNPELINEKLQIFLHSKGSVNINATDGKYGKGAFQLEQLRIELRGDINNQIYYRYQQRLTSDNQTSLSIDNLPLKVDYAGIGYRFNHQLRLFAGKMAVAYGSFEFDENPINVYQYSLLHENMISFLSGIDLTYDMTPNHELRLQILNARNESIEKTYGKLPNYIKENKCDLLYTINWNGNFGPENLISTRWSASILNEARNNQMYYAALGTAFNLSRIHIFTDLLYSREQLDRKQMLTQLLSDHNEGVTLTNVDYKSAILGMNVRIAPKWNLVLKGSTDIASKTKQENAIQKGRYRTTYSYTTTLEFSPLKQENLHLNLAYTGRNHQFSSLGKDYGLNNYHENRFELSFIYAMRLF